MGSTFSLASDTTLAYEPLHVIVPFKAPEGDRWDQLKLRLEEPLDLFTPAKKVKPFSIAGILENVELKNDGDVPVVAMTFSEKGWDRLAYLFLQDMAKEVKSNPKGMPRSYRAYANLMNKLTEEPTGNGKNDNARKVVIDRAIEQLAQGLRDELTRRIQNFEEFERKNNSIVSVS